MRTSRKVFTRAWPKKKKKHKCTANDIKYPENVYITRFKAVETDSQFPNPPTYYKSFQFEDQITPLGANLLFSRPHQPGSVSPSRASINFRRIWPEDMPPNLLLVGPQPAMRLPIPMYRYTVTASSLDLNGSVYWSGRPKAQNIPT